MSLFTDGPISQIEDLTMLDSQLLTVANVEGIDVTQKVLLAQEELGLELSVLMRSLRPAQPDYIWEPVFELKHVIVTPGLRLWHSYRTLELVYSDAFSSQLNDRYGARRDEFHEMAVWAREKLMQRGIGLVPNPVPRAETPQLTAIAGDVPDGTYYVTTAWVNAEGAEGASAVPAVITVSGSGMAVNSGSAPSGVAGWNVFIGDGPDAMVLQNSMPLMPDAIWQQTSPISTTGQGPGSGQRATYFKSLPRILQRG